MTDSPSIFVTPEWLAAHLGDTDLIVVDGSWYLPAMNRDPEAEYRAGHIPGAVRFDIDAVRDEASPLPHMLPSPEDFARKVGAMGIADGMRIVVYDGAGLFAAPRVRWTFRVFGASPVFILEGGLPAWVAEGRPLERGEPARPARTFTPRFDAGAVAGLAAMRATVAGADAQIVDARPADRFRGEAPEPRPGLRSGHMPGAFNVSATSLIANGRLKPVDDILAAFRGVGVDPDRPVVTSCGSGVTAAILSLALEQAGKPARALYDGSWAEWGAAGLDTPVATGQGRKEP